MGGREPQGPPPWWRPQRLPALGPLSEWTHHCHPGLLGPRTQGEGRSGSGRAAAGPQQCVTVEGRPCLHGGGRVSPSCRAGVVGLVPSGAEGSDPRGPCPASMQHVPCMPGAHAGTGHVSPRFTLPGSHGTGTGLTPLADGDKCSEVSSWLSVPGQCQAARVQNPGSSPPLHWWPFPA